MITYLINVRSLTKVAIAQSTGLSDGHIRNLEIGKRGKSISFDGGMALIEFYNSEVKKEKRKKSKRRIRDEYEGEYDKQDEYEEDSQKEFNDYEE